ncbi:MAG: hypothetical protein COB77_03875, partial [Gammaproteobacteria bacterium]
MLYKPAKDNSDVEIKTLDENKKAALSLAEQALKSIDIFTQDMDAELFNNKSFEQSIFALARKHPSTKVRILVQESTRVMKEMVTSTNEWENLLLMAGSPDKTILVGFKNDSLKYLTGKTL